MNNRALIEVYFEVFFKSHEFDRLNEIFDEKMKFKGPFIECSNRAEYIESLKKDPPENCNYVIESTLDNKDEVGVFYTFHKGGLKIPMAQHFTISGGKIIKIQLIFDSGCIK